MPHKQILTPSSTDEVAFGALAAAAMRQAPTFFGVCDALLRFAFLNPAGRAMIGLSADADITAFQIGEFFTPQDRTLVEEVGIPTMLREGRWAGELSFRHLTEPGRQIEMHWSIFALRGEARDLIGAAAFTADIIAHEQTEPALRDQQTLLASVPDSLPLGVGVYDHYGELLHSNQRMRDFAGLARLSSRDLASSQRWRGYNSDGRSIPPECYPGAIELVVGVSRDTTERRAIEESVKKSEARLRAATELVGLGIYSWNPVTGALEWDERLRTMWGLPPNAEINMGVFEAGIHSDDLPRVRHAIAACSDPDGDGRYNLEYDVIGRDDGVTRHIATSGRTTFEHAKAVDFIGVAIDVTAQRRAEAAIRASEEQFRSFAEHSSSLIWISDPAAGKIIYRSGAFEKIWGMPIENAPTALAEWMDVIHPDDRQHVERALATVRAGDVAKYEYRITRSVDGTIRWLRDTSFPIRDEYGAVARIGGIAEDLTPQDERQIYLISGKAAEARRLVALVRGTGHRARIFDSASAFLDIAPVLTPGCVLVDLRGSRLQNLAIPRELKARSITLPTIILDGPTADVASAVTAMKAGAVDYLIVTEDDAFRDTLTNAMAECQGAARPSTRDEKAASRVARLTPREREVLLHLVEGGTNKTIGQKLGISPRTVELHRAQVMHQLNAGSLTELLQMALAAGVAPHT